MTSRAPFFHGAGEPGRTEDAHGFTLLEMCMVLLIIAVLAGTLMPAISSAFVENAVREDSRQLSLMVKTAMIESTDQHRPYEIDLDQTYLDLHPLAVTAKPTDNTEADADSSADAATEDVEISQKLDPANKLLVPDPKKADTWMAMPSTAWIFQPGELCPATPVRLARGESWVQLNFNALTGNVENETAYFP